MARRSGEEGGEVGELRDPKAARIKLTSVKLHDWFLLAAGLVFDGNGYLVISTP